MDRTQDIIKQIKRLSGSRSSYEVFCDWIKCSALAIAQTTIYSKQRETQYLSTAKKYSNEELQVFANMLNLLTETMEDQMADILGDIFMQSGWGNKHTGQFFTPYCISRMMAKLVYSKTDDIVSMNEPTSGSGGMIIAMADEMKSQGVDYQQKLRVVAQDLDFNAFYMCFIQLSLYGIDAKCVQGNSLACAPYSVFDDNVMVTPMFILNGASW